MGLLKAVLYGVVQGITGWLPISSLAHLQIIKTYLDPQYPTPEFTAYIAVVQLGSTVAVLLYFAHDLAKGFKGWWNSLMGRDKDSVDARLGWGVFIGTLPMLLLVPFHKALESQALREIRVIATLMIVFGFVMLLADKYGKKTRTLDDVKPRDGIVPGLLQIFAGLPGVSRSGVTIVGALANGMDMPTAARFSFLMSVPSVVGAGIFEFVKERHHIVGHELPATLVGTVVAAIAGYATIAYLLKYLQKHGLIAFVIYRFALGIFLWILVLTGNVPVQAKDTPTAERTIARPVAMR